MATITNKKTVSLTAGTVTSSIINVIQLPMTVGKGAITVSFQDETGDFACDVSCYIGTDTRSTNPAKVKIPTTYSYSAADDSVIFNIDVAVGFWQLEFEVTAGTADVVYSAVFR